MAIVSRNSENYEKSLAIQLVASRDSNQILPEPMSTVLPLHQSARGRRGRSRSWDIRKSRALKKWKVRLEDPASLCNHRTKEMFFLVRLFSNAIQCVTGTFATL
jgi:hypothetical protein